MHAHLLVFATAKQLLYLLDATADLDVARPEAREQREGAVSPPQVVSAQLIQRLLLERTLLTHRTNVLPLPGAFHNQTLGAQNAATRPPSDTTHTPSSARRSSVSKTSAAVRRVERTAYRIVICSRSPGWRL